MGIMDSYYQVKCTVWEVTEEVDEYGNPVQSASNPFHVWCGVEYVEKIVRNTQGVEIRCDSQLLLKDKYSLNCWIYVGDWIDGTDIHKEARRPVTINANRLVVGSEIIGWWYML